VQRVITNHLAIGAFVARVAGCLYDPANDSVIGVVDDDKPRAWVRGGVIYTGFTGSSCFVHVAARDEKWLTHDMLWAAFDYPFRQLGCGMMFSIIAAANNHALRFNLRIGFKELYHIPGMFPSGDGVLTGMARAECRWLGLKPRTLVAGMGGVGDGR
jgi:hypothetical protein